MSDPRAYYRGTDIGQSIRGTDTEFYSKKVDKNTTYYASAPMGTSINESKWALMKLYDDGIITRKSYPLFWKGFTDYNPAVGDQSTRYDNFDPTDDTTYTPKEISFSADFYYKATDLDQLYYSDILDTIIT